MSKLIKIGIMGDGGVGKSSIITRLCGGTYIPGMPMSQEFVEKKVAKSDQEYTLQIYDISPLDKKRINPVCSNYIRSSRAIVIVFDLSERETLVSLPEWLERVNSVLGPENNLKIFVVGNKCDVSNGRLDFEISGDAMKYCRENKLKYIETSAHNDINVTKLFDEIVDELCVPVPEPVRQRQQQQQQTSWFGQFCVVL